jgi:hypothetical protein
MRRRAFGLVLVLVVTLIFTVQGAASAGSGRIKAIDIGMNAPVKKVGMKNGRLAVGSNAHTVYAWNHGDPPCDPFGSTVYSGHAWKSGDGVADKWGKLRRGNIIQVSGCKFEVTKVQYWSVPKADKASKRLNRVDGSPRIVLIGCKPDNYAKRTMVFARLID